MQAALFGRQPVGVCCQYGGGGDGQTGRDEPIETGALASDLFHGMARAFEVGEQTIARAGDKGHGATTSKL